MQAALLFSVVCSSLLVPGDKRAARTYLNSYLEPTTKGKAAFYKVPAGQDGALYLGKIFTMHDELKAEGHYADPELKIPQGHFVFYYPNGKVESEGDYAQGNKSGVWQRFDEWGQALAEKVYDPEPLENIVYTRAPTMPQFPGGESAMITYMRSSGAAKGGVASFVVERNGDLSDIKVSGVPASVQDQLVQALEKAPPFMSGEKDGVPVRVQMRVPLE